jgi:L-amino acid N-acyltransferase YncA
VIVRTARPEDAAQMAEILDRIVAIGGTTAHETPRTADPVRDRHVTGPDVRSSFVAEDGGQLVGSQAVEWLRGEAHSGTFLRPGKQASGIGVALFAQTRPPLGALGPTAIIAGIRADNVAARAYDARSGFVDLACDPDDARRDGRVVGRVHRRFDLV